MSIVPENAANNRNWDADVRKDLMDALDKLAPENADYRHNEEGRDDMVHSIQCLS